MRDLTQREKFILGGAAAMAVLAFFPWLKVSFGEEGMGELFKAMGAASGGGSANGFSSADGVIAFLAALGTVALVLADRAGALPWPAPKRLVAPLIAAGVSALCMIIYFGRSGGSTGPVSVGKTFWFYLALLAIGFAAFHAYQRWTEGNKSADPASAPWSPPPPPPPAPPASPPPV